MVTYNYIQYNVVCTCKAKADMIIIKYANNNVHTIIKQEYVLVLEQRTVGCEYRALQPRVS